MKKYSPGEIVEVAFPYEESTEEKIRPVLVLKDYGNEMLVMKITSKHKGREWDIEIPVDAFNGLTRPSVIQVDRCVKVSKSKLSAVIPRGVINSLQFEIVKRRLKEYISQHRNQQEG
ncbi:MAG: type II toxin-antitoxin system PemK/MazF family toxin [Synergistaceae bacterium]|nr:type II toxin-antitoxin system PemK/MazF family toxin [Synergistaceae bacterium]